MLGPICIDLARLKSHLSIVLQEKSLFNYSMRNNIALAGQRVNVAKVITAARLAGVHVAMRKPMTYT